eukprot:gene10536-biopygen8042
MELAYMDTVQRLAEARVSTAKLAEASRKPADA